MITYILDYSLYTNYKLQRYAEVETLYEKMGVFFYIV